VAPTRNSTLHFGYNNLEGNFHLWISPFTSFKPNYKEAPMKIKVLKLGHSASEVDVASGSSIQEALTKVGFPHEGHAISLNGMGAGPSTALGEGDIVALVPKVEGGR